MHKDEVLAVSRVKVDVPMFSSRRIGTFWSAEISKTPYAIFLISFEAWLFNNTA
jgi:hypothetical protein